MAIGMSGLERLGDPLNVGNGTNRLYPAEAARNCSRSTSADTPHPTHFIELS